MKRPVAQPGDFLYFLKPGHPKLVASRLGELCKARNDGFVCNRELGHSGDHEAYDAGGVCQHWWPAKELPRC